MGGYRWYYWSGGVVNDWAIVSHLNWKTKKAGVASMYFVLIPM